jgi:hypothetical protein
MYLCTEDLQRYPRVSSPSIFNISQWQLCHKPLHIPRQSITAIQSS